VGGIPGHGKSSLLDALTVNLARLHGWRFAVCSPENQPLEEHAARLMAIYDGRPFHDGPTARMSVDAKDRAKRWLDAHFTFLLPDENGRTIESVLALARLTHHTAPLDGLVIDPWNELDHARPAGMREDEHISRSLTRIRAFARQHDLHVWLVAHPKKLEKQADGTYPVPTPYDISGAAHWRNKADNALAVWRDHGRPEDGTQVHAQKVRFQPWEGTEGMVRLMFDRVTGRFRESVELVDERYGA
jgi:twinkle protein